MAEKREGGGGGGGGELSGRGRDRLTQSMEGARGRRN